MNNQYTRFRAYHVPDGCAYSYTVSKEFCLIGGRYHQSMKRSLAEEMRIAGCDTIDLLHIPSWNNKMCNADEIEEMLGLLRPTEIEIPAYIPEDKAGKRSRTIILDYCSQSSISELYICTPKFIRRNNPLGNNRIIVSPMTDYTIPEDNDLVEFIGHGKFSMLSTGLVHTQEIAHEIAQNEDIRNVDLLILQGIRNNIFARSTFVNPINPKIIVDVLDNNQYYRRSDVVLEDYGISTMRNDKGEVIITCGENDIDYEIDTPLVASSSIGVNYRGEGLSDSDISEQIQEWVWAHPIEDLDILAHHYEVEDVSDMEILDYEEKNGVVVVKLTFMISVTLYMDNEDDKGFSMQFPAECKAEFDKGGVRYNIHPDTVEIKVNTDEYYR